MTTNEKLAAILAAVQTDPGRRGLANLFTYCPGDFAAACRSIADQPDPAIDIVTGFYIPTASPPAHETDGPLGAVFLARALVPLSIGIGISSERACQNALATGLRAARFRDIRTSHWDPDPSPGGETADRLVHLEPKLPGSTRRRTHHLALERVGPADDGKCYTMRGLDITDRTTPTDGLFPNSQFSPVKTIGIGDGGNEIGMGKIPHDRVAADIPNGDQIHCRLATTFLIVAGVSNWGAYALAAGIYVLRNAKPPADLFNSDREREILEAMVKAGPLVDGVTGTPTATVDGLSWDDYAAPMRHIRDILGA